VHHLQGNTIPAGHAVEHFSVKTIKLFPLPNLHFIHAGVWL